MTDRLNHRGGRAAVVGLALMAALFLAVRIVAGPPRYRACVAALERVTISMSWPDAEAHLAAAIAAGAVAYSNRGDPPWTPGRSALVQPDPPVPDIEEVVLLCWRIDPESNNPLGGILHQVWQWVVAIEPRLISGLAVTPTDYTQLVTRRMSATVSSTSLLDCVAFDTGSDYWDGFDPPLGCRHHSPRRR